MVDWSGPTDKDGINKSMQYCHGFMTSTNNQLIDYINNESHSNTREFLSKDIKKEKREIDLHRDEISSPTTFSNKNKRIGRSK